MAARKFELVEDETDRPSAPTRAEAAGLNLIMMGLGALSQRAIAAVKDLFTLLSVGSAFWLWWSIPQPDVLQIVSLTIYALFVLSANWIVRRA